jgi:acyl carrier protein
MNEVEFLSKIEEQFQETPVGTLNLDSRFKETSEWGSLVALCIIAMVDENYGKTLSGDELTECDTIKDIYQKISGKPS